MASLVPDNIKEHDITNWCCEGNDPQRSIIIPAHILGKAAPSRKQVRLAQKTPDSGLVGLKTLFVYLPEGQFPTGRIWKCSIALDEKLFPRSTQGILTLPASRLIVTMDGIRPLYWS